MATEKKCVLSGFCWRNPVHVVVALAVLPFAVDGLAMVCKLVLLPFATSCAN